MNRTHEVITRAWMVAAAAMFLALVAPGSAAQSNGGRGAAAATNAAAQGAGSQELQAARSAFRTGDYTRAIAALERLTTGANPSPAAARHLIRAYLEVGRYDDAERLGARFTTAPGAAIVATALGDAYHVRGKLTEAEAAYRRAVADRAPDSLTAIVRLGVLAYERGARNDALETFDRFIDFYNNGVAKSSEDFTAVAIACRYLGFSEPEMFKDALKAFDKAIAADSMDIEPQLLVGELFLEKYATPEAQGEFEKLLSINPRHPRGLLGVAMRRLADGHPGVDTLLTMALAINPGLAEARRIRARLRMDVEDYAAAVEEVNMALSVDPGSPQSLAILSAIQLLRGDTAAHNATNARILQRNSRYADMYVTLAEANARGRLYRQAADFASKAVELDPSNWNAHQELGINQLRIGQIEEGRKSLETAFKGDPYNVLVKNTLDLLDTFKEYDVIDNGMFRLMIGKQESALLGLYATDLLERTYEKFATRYGFRPGPQVRVEFYRRHADFSVRTVGLMGIGALGVSFGNVLAMDSPVGRGEETRFNWGSVLLHELGHTFTLGVTNNRIPRWMSEGLSVFEERHSGLPGWGAEVSPDFLRAFKADLILPVSQLNAGFTRPRYPEQLMHSYYQASLVCEMIVEKGGDRALTAMLAAYKSGQSTEQAFRAALNMSLEEVDKAFVEYVKTKFRTHLSAVGQAQLVTVDGSGAPRIQQEADSGDFVKAMAAAKSALTAGNDQEATRQLERAIALFPEYAEDDSPYIGMSQIVAKRGDSKGAADWLAKHNALNENSYLTHQAEGMFRESAGDLAGAVKVLDRAMYIYPYDIRTHEKLADLATRTGDRKMAVRERRAIVALKPVDMAEAYYQLALALHESGDNVAARREVLKALEEAPNFGKAQELLLRLRSGDLEARR